MSAEDIRKKIRRIEIVTSKLVEQVFAGQYESLFKGRGIEFAEFREYLPGDDVRNIDWNVTARFGRPFVKRNEEERELAMMLVVDNSGSLTFGSGQQSKRELAGEIGAILAFSALVNNDKIGLMLFSDEVDEYIPPGKGRRHVLRLIREILAPPAEGRGTNLGQALSRLNRVHKRRALVFVLSDFLGSPFADLEKERDTAVRMLRLTGRRHDLSAFRLYDPREQQIPAVGRIRLKDLESGKTVLLDTNDPGFQQNFQQQVDKRQLGLRKVFEAARVDYAEYATDQAPVQNLVRFFARKQARRKARA
ncbi:MAG: DUF58 domain-containing protein [Vulcanimicrobiota bacterium]